MVAAGTGLSVTAAKAGDSETCGRTILRSSSISAGESGWALPRGEAGVSVGGSMASSVVWLAGAGSGVSEVMAMTGLISGRFSGTGGFNAARTVTVSCSSAGASGSWTCSTSGSCACGVSAATGAPAATVPCLGARMGTGTAEGRAANCGCSGSAGAAGSGCGVAGCGAAAGSVVVTGRGAGVDTASSSSSSSRLVLARRWKKFSSLALGCESGTSLPLAERRL